MACEAGRVGAAPGRQSSSAEESHPRLSNHAHLAVQSDPPSPLRLQNCNDCTKDWSVCTNCGEQHIAVNGSCVPCAPGCTWSGLPATAPASWGGGQQYPEACRADGTCKQCDTGYGGVGDKCEKVRSWFIDRGAGEIAHPAGLTGGECRRAAPAWPSLLFYSFALYSTALFYLKRHVSCSIFVNLVCCPSLTAVPSGVVRAV